MASSWKLLTVGNWILICPLHLLLQSKNENSQFTPKMTFNDITYRYAHTEVACHFSASPIRNRCFASHMQSTYAPLNPLVCRPYVHKWDALLEPGWCDRPPSINLCPTKRFSIIGTDSPSAATRRNKSINHLTAYVDVTLQCYSRKVISYADSMYVDRYYEK